jgi:type II secretory ATPase GspE/PulE/Tfp pilus assembly ATPase PilB-like protein
MSRDIHCKKCGEPYSEYALQNDVSEWDGQPDDAHERFMNGQGCPTCEWGEKVGDVSTSRFKSEDELKMHHVEDIMNNTDKDPLRFF